MNDMEEARLEIAETRAHLHETAEELSAALSQRVGAAKERVSPAHYAREYPWAALGLAVGVGMALGISGAERKAAAVIVAGASSVKDKAVERFQRDDDADAKPVVAKPETPHKPSVRERIAGEIDTMLADGLQDFMKSVGVSA